MLPFSSGGSHLRMYKHRIPSEEGTSTTVYRVGLAGGTANGSFRWLCPINRGEPEGAHRRMFALSFSSGGSHLRTYKHKTPSEEGTSAMELDWRGGTVSGSMVEPN